jgi:Circularly permutated YpsA SLOG family
VPRGGWTEDFPQPPGLLVTYPRLIETPSADPAQRTEWNVRDANAILIVVDEAGVAVSKGTTLAVGLAERYRRPALTIDPNVQVARARTTAWLAEHRGIFGDGFVLSIGGPRESEAPGIYARAFTFLQRGKSG